MSMRILLVLAALLELGSALSLHLAEELALQGSATELKPLAKPWGAEDRLLGTRLDSQTPCEDAAEGSNCYIAVMYLKSSVVRKHPDWYPALNADSLFQDVQAALNNTGKSKCPKPCAMTTDDKIEMKEAGLVATEAHEASTKDKSCRDVAEDGGDRCYRAITWMTKKGLAEHPGWWPALSPTSSTRDVQEELHRQSKADCPRPCRPEELEAPAAAPAASGPPGPGDVLAPPASSPAEGAARPEPQFKPFKDMTPDELDMYIKGKWDGRATTAPEVPAIEAEVMKDTALVKPQMETAAQDEAATMEAEVTKATADAEPQLETAAQDEVPASEAEVTKATADAEPQIETKTAAQDEVPASEAEVAKATADAEPQIETKTAAQDEVPASEAEMTKATADAEPQMETAAKDEVPASEAEVTKATADAEPQIDTKTVAQDEVPASEAEMTNATADAEPQIEANTTAQDEAAAIEAEAAKEKAALEAWGKMSGEQAKVHDLKTKEWGKISEVVDMAEALPMVDIDGKLREERITASEAEVTKDTADAEPQIDTKTAAQDEAAAMEAEVTKEKADGKPQVETAAQDEAAAMEAQVTKDTAVAEPQAETTTAAQDEVPAIEAEMVKVMADEKPQMESAAQGEAAAMEAEVTKDTADAEPQIETKTAAQDEVPASEAEVTKATADAEPQMETKTTVQDEVPAIEAEMTKDTADGKPQMESAAQGEAAAMDAEVTKDTADVEAIQEMEDAMLRTPKVGSKTVDQDGAAVDVEAEMMKGMGDAKPQIHITTTEDDLQGMEDALFRTPRVESKTVAQDGMAAEIEAEVMNDMADATPKV